jgi:hypothetical protein
MMRDVMQSAGLTWFPQLGLVLFLFGFFMALAYVALFVRGDKAEALANMPLDDDQLAHPQDRGV